MTDSATERAPAWRQHDPLPESSESVAISRPPPGTAPLASAPRRSNPNPPPGTRGVAGPPANTASTATNTNSPSVRDPEPTQAIQPRATLWTLPELAAETPSPMEATMQTLITQMRTLFGSLVNIFNADVNKRDAKQQVELLLTNFSQKFLSPSQPLASS